VAGLTAPFLERERTIAGAMEGLDERIDRIARATGFAGVVRVDRDGAVVFAAAYGLADRAHGVPNTVGTRFGIASGTKGLTALTVVRLVEAGAFDLATTARSLLGPDLPAIDDEVTIEHLLSHRSGIGDYLDEDVVHDATEYVMTVPVHELATTESYLRVLDGHAAKFEPGRGFSYCNSGYVVLALLCERATGRSFHELVLDLVCTPAGMRGTTFHRSDEPSADLAVGYLAVDGPRTNLLHLPVRGSGDGGISTTVADVHALWTAMFAGQIVSQDSVAEMVRPRSDVPAESKRYGLGFWLHATTDAVVLEGCDAGVSFRSVCQPSRGITHTVVSNTTDGAWPLARHLDEAL